jgi:CheY-like chemotaxis protein
MPPKILVADDESPIRDLLKRLIARRIPDAEVRTCESAEEALDVLAGESFDVVLSDYRMQRLTGGDLLRWVERNSPQTARMLVTGYNEESFVLQAEDGMRLHALLKKPWDNAALLQTIQDLLAQRAAGTLAPKVVLQGTRGDSHVAEGVQ